MRQGTFELKRADYLGNHVRFLVLGWGAYERGMSKNLDAFGDRGYGAGCLEPLGYLIKVQLQYISQLLGLGPGWVSRQIAFIVETHCNT